ncbi:PREDICTED: uncharacterized protein LOC109167108 [Ipomoea nil]|uniref:uncharacterized protein LOC109167108 n=1 Tax=Ipomoea nil TaxID=35883 RepID=UPI0009015F00|nr:PREDICTED: uncharacterized protein LOC109167108 [Ipomoea nil]
MENSPTAMAFSVLKTLLTSLFFYADKPLIVFVDKCKHLQFIRCFLVSAFLFFLRLLPSLFPSFNASPFQSYKFCFNSKRGEALCPVADGGGGEPGIARALTQVLSIVTDIPVSSRKYEVVRSLAERLIDDNLLDGNKALQEVNRTVLAAAFCRTLKQLESAVIDHGGSHVVTGTPDGGGSVIDDYYRGLRRVVRAAKFYGDLVRRRLSARDELSRSEVSAEKLAAELLWLVQKMTACGCSEDALRRWSSAQHLARLSLSAEPRLQGALVKVSAFLLDQARQLWKEADEESMKYDELRQTNMNMLVSWLPLLCRASNGTDTPVLSINKRAELERTLELIINTLDEEEQEKVLSLWLQHFTYCPSSDWPNLHDIYTRWCTASRTSLLLLN